MRKLFSIICAVMMALPFSTVGNDRLCASISGLDLIVKEDQGAGLTMSLDLDSMRLGKNAELWIMPVIEQSACGKGNSGVFKTAVVAGRNRYLRYQRGYETLPENTVLYCLTDKKEVTYSSALAYADWMKHSEVRINTEMKGCCGSAGATDVVTVAEVNIAPPAFIEPEFTLKASTDAGPKVQNLKGSAYIDFRVNRTDIDAGYRGNVRELSKIMDTIESVCENKDATIKNISIKGYASPEGPYRNNERLARGRTEALKDYVIRHSGLDGKVINTSSEPEDWAGLRRYVADSILENREDMLRIIDSDMDPDSKDAELRKRFPGQYEKLLKDVYPALRHTDYVVSYEIRQFTTVDDIRRAFAYRPENLSENELIMLLADCNPEGMEYPVVLRKGRELFPDNSALLYLDGIGAAKRGEYENAVILLRKAYGGGIAEAREALDSIAAMSEPHTDIVYKNL